MVDDALTVLWKLETRLTDTATAMEKESGSKTLSGPAADKLVQKAEGVQLARSYVWDAIRELHLNGNAPAREHA